MVSAALQGAIVGRDKVGLKMNLPRDKLEEVRERGAALPASLLACVLACLRACVLACLLACLLVFTVCSQHGSCSRPPSLCQA